MRSSAHAIELVKGCIPFILEGEGLPYNSDIFIEIIRNYKVKHADRHHLPEETKDWKYLPPITFRIGQMSGSIDAKYFSRYFAIKAFYFYVLLFPQDCAPEEHDNVLSVFHETHRHAKRLDPNQELISIRTSTRTVLDAYEDQAMSTMKKWIEYYSAKRF